MLLWLVKMSFHIFEYGEKISRESSSRKNGPNLIGLFKGNSVSHGLTYTKTKYQ